MGVRDAAVVGGGEMHRCGSSQRPSGEHRAEYTGAIADTHARVHTYQQRVQDREQEKQVLAGQKEALQTQVSELQASVDALQDEVLKKFSLMT